MVNNHAGDQKRIAKNTVMLYIRMAVIMAVTLYTTRVVLNVLGVTDYGIYNIVGSVVVSMVFIQNSLMSATQRFISYELGLREKGNVSKVFSSSLNLHLKFLFLIVILLETIGLWFLNRVLDIPDDRIYAANVVYQFSILTFCLNIIRIPYNSVILSYESMNIYAVLSIVEAVLKLSIVIALKYMFSDKLIAYSILIFGITFIINGFYISYCRKNYKNDSRLNFHGDKDVIRKLRGFLGWNLMGGVTGVAANEGPSYFMNYYLGVTINAAMGIAKQVSSAVYQFTSNFQTAFNPQIVKAYASNEKEYLYSLINKTSLLSYYLIFIIALPIILCADYIFELWLVEVPRYTVIFCLLMMGSQMITALSSPLWMVAHATGDIKNYQIILGGINLLVIPASFVILVMGYEPYHILVFQLFLSIATLIYRLWFAKSKIGFPVLTFVKDVGLRCIVVSLVIVPIPLLISFSANGIYQMLGVIILTILMSTFVIFLIGLDKESKAMVCGFVKKKLKHDGSC